LLGASVIAVLAGYGVFLLAYGWLSDQDRREAHRQLEGRLLAVVERGGPFSQEGLASGVVAWVESDPLLPQAQRAGQGALTGPWSYQGRSYLFSTTPIGPTRPGASLHVLQEVTREIQQQQRNTLMLMTFAGVSTLVTAALLRPVLKAGLRPLEGLSDGMECIEADLLSQQRLPLEPQPRELQRIARSFNDLLERLAVSWDRQRAFVNGVSHELRTPITLVAGYAARLRRRGVNLSALELEQLQLIEEEAARMGRLVSDLLDLARRDAGQLSLQRLPFCVADTCRQVLERLRPLAAQRLSLQANPETAQEPLLALGDRERFEQCLLNLVENALKYSPASSGVRLAWGYQGDSVVVHVLDRGPGVPKADRMRLLERFQRGRNAADVPGSGIGLAVVNSLMEAMGGAVEIGDAEGGGGDFQLLLPLAQAAPDRLSDPAPSTGAAARAGRS
jgi:signal transduction histidine kinase